MQIFSGFLESQKNFTVSIDGGPRQRIENAEHTVFHEDDDLSVVGAVKSDDPEHWRPDAVVVVSTEGTTVQVSQHTENDTRRAWPCSMSPSQNSTRCRTLSEAGWVWTALRLEVFEMVPPPWRQIQLSGGSRRTLHVFGDAAEEPALSGGMP